MDLNEKVFGNPFLLEQILSHALSDIVADFNYRLINSKFNNAFLVVLRKEYRSMDIKFGAMEGENVEFYFNGRELVNSRISQFFRFLNKVANVRVENLTVRKMKGRDFNVWKALHDAIHSELIGEHRQSIRKFVGVERLCKDCEDCLAIARTAEECGPIKLSNLRRLERVEHPRKLIISSQLLDHIANECVSNFVSKEECFERLDDIIKPDLSSDTLILWLSESQRKRGNTGLRNHFHIPLEILEMFILKWSIKHLRIHFVFEGYNTIHMDYWMDTEYFTAFRFNDREDFGVKEPRMKLDSIEVDLIDSFYCRRDFARVSAAGDRGYSNLLVNIQKVFSTNLISIKNLFKSSLELPEVHIAFRRILKILSKSGRLQIDCKEQLPVLTVNLEHLIRIPDFSEFSSKAEQGNVTYFDVPDEFSNSKSPSFFVFRRPPLEPIYSPKGVMNMKFIGKKYVLEHNGVVFNLGIFLNETAIHEETTNRNVKEFLKFFL